MDTGPKAPDSATFREHKSVIYVDSEHSLQQLVAILTLSEPRWVGVDIEHSKRHAYHGMICLIQLSWPIYALNKVSMQTFLVDTLALSKT